VGNNLLFSIIIPVYNIEQYLKQCLESIINQSYNNIEVILINDGSTDKSGVICEEVSILDNRFKVVHTENRGVSSARNMGLSIATGDYIVFVDSDDWLENKAIEKINNLLQDRLYDLIIFGVVKEINNQQIPMYSNQTSGCINSNKDIENVLPLLIKQEVINPPFKVYKHELIRNNGIKFETSVNIAEDYLFNMQCFLNANSLYVMEDILYHYMIRDNISLTRKFQVDKYQKLMQVNDKLKDIVSLKGNNDRIEEALLYIRLKNIYSCFLDIFNKDCKYNYQEKLAHLKRIINKEKKVNFFKIKDRNYKILAIILKLNSSKLIYLLSKILTRVKEKTTLCKFINISRRFFNNQ